MSLRQIASVDGISYVSELGFVCLVSLVGMWSEVRRFRKTVYRTKIFELSRCLPQRTPLPFSEQRPARDCHCLEAVPLGKDAEKWRSTYVESFGKASSSRQWALRSSPNHGITVTAIHTFGKSEQGGTIKNSQPTTTVSGKRKRDMLGCSSVPTSGTSVFYLDT